MLRLLKINIFILLLSFLIVSSSYALDFGKDNGTDKDGVFIFPKEFALRCDIKSEDVAKEKVMSKCLNEILLLGKGSSIGKDNIKDVFDKSYHQMNAAYITLALNKKKLASEYEEEMDKILGSEIFSAAELLDEEASLKKKQTQIAKLGYMTSKNIVDIIDVYTAQIAIDAMENYGIYEMSKDAAPIED